MNATFPEDARLCRCICCFCKLRVTNSYIVDFFGSIGTPITILKRKPTHKSCMPKNKSTILKWKDYWSTLTKGGIDILIYIDNWYIAYKKNRSNRVLHSFLRLKHCRQGKTTWQRVQRVDYITALTLKQSRALSDPQINNNPRCCCAHVWSGCNDDLLPNVRKPKTPFSD